MLRHATAPKTERRGRPLNVGGRLVVESCPGGDYPTGCIFNLGTVIDGLEFDNWPDGMVFVGRSKRYVVRGGHLVNEEGGLCH
jgi:hypothetical protein